MQSSVIAKVLLENECVQFSPENPFVYASGLKGPIYCDNRRLLGFPVARQQVVRELLSAYKDEGFHGGLAGLATAGIPHASFLADRLEKPLIYIRSRPKGHGQGNQIEGAFEAGQSFVLVEDLINQGSSLEKAVIAAKNGQIKIEGVLCLVDYLMPAAKERYKRLGLKVRSLVDFNDLLDCAREMGTLDAKGQEILRRWHEDPMKW